MPQLIEQSLFLFKHMLLNSCPFLFFSSPTTSGASARPPRRTWTCASASTPGTSSAASSASGSGSSTSGAMTSPSQTGWSREGCQGEWGCVLFCGKTLASIRAKRWYTQSCNNYVYTTVHTGASCFLYLSELFFKKILHRCQSLSWYQISKNIFERKKSNIFRNFEPWWWCLFQNRSFFCRFSSLLLICNSDFFFAFQGKALLLMLRFPLALWRKILFGCH